MRMYSFWYPLTPSAWSLLLYLHVLNSFGGRNVTGITLFDVGANFYKLAFRREEAFYKK